MNGRVYDPQIGRFLSPDPFVQAPGYSQSYNRYSYVWNNPLGLIDPTGYNPAVAGSLGTQSSEGTKKSKQTRERNKAKNKAKRERTQKFANMATSLKRRKDVTRRLGPDGPHGRRDAAEEDLLRSLNKFLGD